VLNALESMPDGGEIMVSGERLSGDAGWVEVTIQDNGAGIAPDRFQHIFEPFFSTKENGTGLGLWISHSIITAHQGQLIVESEPGMGTKVRVQLPAIQGEVKRS
jgi:signal transduction histidine kinase